MKHMILRWLALALALCLTTTALAAPADPMPELNEPIRNLFFWEGTLYAAGVSCQLYREGEGGWLPVGRVAEDTRAMDASEGALWQLVREEDGSGYRIDRAPFLPDGRLGEGETGPAVAWDVNAGDWPECRGMAVEGGDAYVLMESGADFTQSALYRVALESGKATKLLTAPLTELTRYRDGLLLARRFSWEEYGQGDSGKDVPQIVTLDPASERMETVGLMTGYMDGALTYDRAADSVYFSGGSYVLRAAGDRPEKVGYLLPGGMSYEGVPAAARDGRYAVNSDGGLLACDLDPASLPQRTLRVAYTYEIEELVVRFARLHPEVAVELVDHIPSAAEMTLRMGSPEALDVYLCALDSDFMNLRDKGYLADLGECEALVEAVGRMDARLTSALYLDGRLCALPCVLGVMVDGFYPEALEEAGVSLPGSYEELLDFIADWRSEDTRLFEDSYDLRYELFLRMVIAQILDCQARGLTPTMNESGIRGLLEKLEALAPELAAEDAVMAEGALFTGNVDLLPKTWTVMNAASPMILRLEREGMPVIPAQMGVLAVNPLSGSIDIALELLTYVAEHLPETLRIALMPDENEPIPLYSEAEVAAMRRSVEEGEQALAAAPEEERAELENELSWQRAVLSRMEEAPWAYSPEEIAFYRENIEPYLTFPLSPAFGVASEPLESLYGRYLDGQLSLEAFIAEFDRVIWMIENE